MHTFIDRNTITDTAGVYDSAGDKKVLLIFEILRDGVIKKVASVYQRYKAEPNWNSGLGFRCST